MKILLDTQCWLWMQVSPERISAANRTRLRDARNQLFLSAASAWEIAVKYALGKLPLPLHPIEYVPSRLAISGTLSLPVEHRHALHVATLPQHHKDLFDRLLIAQAQLENLTLLTADSQILAYEVSLLQA